MVSINPIAVFRSPLTSKFGVPRQSGLVSSLEGEIVFLPEYSKQDAFRGIDGFDYLWLIWGFSANVIQDASNFRPLVRPPLLGGNEYVGVFATRSPFRPNGLGLSSVRIAGIVTDDSRGIVIKVLGADLMDGTPIYDVKPYIPYVDCHPGARGGFTDSHEWRSLRVSIPDNLLSLVPENCRASLLETLSLDPRPHYHDDPERVYGMPFRDKDIRFKVEGDELIVVDVVDVANADGGIERV